MSNNPAPDPPAADFDSPWKEAIDAFFEPFMRLFFPAAHDLIDWSRRPEFLDAELQRITGDSTLGRRHADRLVKVWSRSGVEVWLLLHIEVQGQADAGFPQRMFQYWYRIYDRYGEVGIISLALLTNEHAPGPTGTYRRMQDGVGLAFSFHLHGLPDHDEPELVARAADNPFAVVALAQRAAHARVSASARKVRKRDIIALLYRHRYSREDAIKLLRFIDWLIRLPKPLELALRQELAELEEQTQMSYVTSWERFAREEGYTLGMDAGRQEGQAIGERLGEARALLRLLQTRFGTPSAELVARVEAATADELNLWLTRVLTAASSDEVIGAP